jgi:hypothetical protein
MLSGSGFAEPQRALVPINLHKESGNRAADCARASGIVNFTERNDVFVAFKACDEFAERQLRR